MNNHKIKKSNNLFYLKKVNGTNYIYTKTTAPDPGYYCVVDSLTMESSCVDLSQNIGQNFIVIGGPYGSLEECQNNCSAEQSGYPVPISGFEYGIINYESSQRCSPLPGFIELCCDNPEDGILEWRFSIPEDEDDVDFYIIRRRESENIRTSATSTGYSPGYNGPVTILPIEPPTNFEAFFVTSTSGTGNNFVATTVYKSGYSFYEDGGALDPQYLGISKIEFSKEFAPKITFRNETAKTRFTTGSMGQGKNHDMILGVNDSGNNNRPYVGLHKLLANRISEQTSTTVAYSGSLADLTVAMSGIDELLADLESRGTNSNYLYIQIDYDAMELLIDNCSSFDNIKTPLIFPKWFLADSAFRETNRYRITLVHNPSCSYHSYQAIAVNVSGQSIPKPETIVEKSTYGSGWVYKGNQEWNVSNDGGSLRFEWLPFTSLCPPEVAYYFNKNSGPCAGINGPYETLAECTSASAACGTPITPCYNEQLSVTLEYVSGIMTNIYDEEDIYEATSTTPGLINMTPPPNGWYYFKGIEGYYVEQADGSVVLCEYETEKCSGGGYSLRPYMSTFFVRDGQVVTDGNFPIIN